jgi:hypothetical protein
MATTKTTGKRYSSKPPTEVKFYTSKGKMNGQPWNYEIVLQLQGGKTQRISFSEEEMKLIISHLGEFSKL